MKNELRMTMEELKSLKPSFENPVTLICDDGHFSDILREIKIIGIKDKEGLIYIEEKDGRVCNYIIDVFGQYILPHYPSLKQNFN